MLTDDEKEVLRPAEERKRLKMAYPDDKRLLLLRDRLIEAREESKRLEAELGFKYGKQCHCGYTVWVIPNECKDGSL